MAGGHQVLNRATGGLGVGKCSKPATPGPPQGHHTQPHSCQSRVSSLLRWYRARYDLSLGSGSGLSPHLRVWPTTTQAHQWDKLRDPPRIVGTRAPHP
jgi:hypothetical protein